ncbi:MAG: RimK family alpha-L-glutamate ligase [Oscillospiraceae bacterium]|nr:RimK family alpha-L-glutamate ligase [Oscillospiraceae bacterium]
MTGWLITNAFVDAPLFGEHFDMLIAAAKKRGIALTRKTNAELLLGCDNLPDFALFWDKDIRLANMLERQGLRLFNTAHAIEICDDKALTHLALKGTVKMPETYIAPKTYEQVGYGDYGYLEPIAERLGFPMVIKGCFGSFGAQVFLAKSRREMRDIAGLMGVKPFLFQEYIKSSHGRDMRIYVVGGKVAAAMIRRSLDGDFRSNVTNGGSAESTEPPCEYTEMALAACEKLRLDFGGVDILFGTDGEPVLCEVNSNAHFKALSKCAGVDIAGKIIDYIALTDLQSV